MKKVFSLFFAVMLILSLGACDNGGSPSEPRTIMDAFGGARRVWYWTTDDDVSGDAEIRMVLVSEEKQIVNAYYKFAAADEVTFESEPNPLSGEQLTLKSVAGKSDDEILALVSQNYADITKEYVGAYKEDEYTFSKVKLPFEMTYSGRLNSEKGNIKYETLNFFGEDISVHSKLAAQLVEGEYRVEDFVAPTKVESAEFVGFANGEQALVTANTFTSFDVDFDSTDDAEYAY